MVFNSFSFFLFFALVLAVYSLNISWTTRKTALVGFSYLFYMAFHPPFVLLLWISTVVDWHAAKQISRAAGSLHKKFWLVVSLTVNLGLLAFFKYGDFLLDNFIRLLGLFAIDYAPPEMGIVLPVGISFYTFQSLSYTLDVYMGRMEKAGSPIDFALYVTFFPQLVAGPIVRATHFLPQCAAPGRITAERMGWGMFLLVTGLFGKVVLADAFFAPAADAVFSQPAQAGFMGAWVGVLAFSSQIFFDFAGYSTCAIGAALCLGFVLPENFRFPYGAVGFSDFWRRWHISLSTWLRDYVYIPFGGNRNGLGRTRINLMATMLIGGLWHGAAWTFVVWGGLHGLLLVIEQTIKKRFGSVRLEHQVILPFLLAALTYFCICLTWVFFRAQDFDDAWILLYQMVRVDAALPQIVDHPAWVALGAVGLFVFHFAMRQKSPARLAWLMPLWARAFLLAFMLICLSLVPGDDRAFIYFQF